MPNEISERRELRLREAVILTGSWLGAVFLAGVASKVSREMGASDTVAWGVLAAVFMAVWFPGLRVLNRAIFGVELRFTKRLPWMVLALATGILISILITRS